MERIPDGHMEVTYKSEDNEVITEIMTIKDYNKRILVRALRGSVKILSYRFGDGDLICVARA